MQAQVKKVQLSLDEIKRANAQDLRVEVKQAALDTLLGELKALDQYTKYSETNAQVLGAKALKKLASESTSTPA